MKAITPFVITVSGPMKKNYSLSPSSPLFKPTTMIPSGADSSFSLLKSWNWKLVCSRAPSRAQVVPVLELSHLLGELSHPCDFDRQPPLDSEVENLVDVDLKHQEED